MTPLDPEVYLWMMEEMDDMMDFQEEEYNERFTAAYEPHQKES